MNNGNADYLFRVTSKQGLILSYTVPSKSIGVINILDDGNISRINSDNYTHINCTDLWNVHFLNKLGGWETIVMRGNYQISQLYTRYNYLNKDLENRTYKTDTNIRLTLNTNWIPDDVSENIGDLMGSNSIVVSKSGVSTEEVNKTRQYAYIVNGETDVKTFRRNGRQLNNYNITFEIDKTFTRR